MKQEFHIHVDAWEISPEFVARLKNEWNFTISDFVGHPEGTEGFEPPYHLTFKTDSSIEFKKIFEDVVASAKTPSAIRGYIEGEFLPLDEAIVERNFRDSVASPIQKLNLGEFSSGQFRESEIHIVMDAERSDPRLLNILSQLGFFSAYMNKSYGRAIIFTVGGSRDFIQLLLDPIRSYLREVGGAVAGSVKEERIANYWISESNFRLPPIVKSIDWAG
jgi:hypothetical protein